MLRAVLKAALKKSFLLRCASLRAGLRQQGMDIRQRFTARLKSGPDTSLHIPRVFPQALKLGPDTRLLLGKLFWQPSRSLRQRLHAGRCAQIATITFVSVVCLGAGDDTEARFNNLGHHKLICPCGCNQILLECNHVGCTFSDTMRTELMNGLRRGDSDDLVLQAFVQKYGPTVLAAPTTTGFNRIAWIMPFAVLLAGFGFAALIVTSWKNRPLVAPQSSQTRGAIGEFREQARRETEL